VKRVYQQQRRCARSQAAIIAKKAASHTKEDQNKTPQNCTRCKPRCRLRLFLIAQTYRNSSHPHNLTRYLKAQDDYGLWLARTIASIEEAKRHPPCFKNSTKLYYAFTLSDEIGEKRRDYVLGNPSPDAIEPSA